MKERTSKPWRDRMRSAPKALLCIAISRAKRVAYPESAPAEPASQRALAPSAAPAGAAAPSDAPARPASYGEGMGGAGMAVQVAVIERADILAL